MARTGAFINEFSHLLLILALIFGGVGLFVEGLKWFLMFSLVPILVGALAGYRGRRTVL